MSCIRVVEFIESLGDGGAENLVKDYALMLPKDKYDVTVCVVRNDNTRRIENILKENGVKIVKLYPDWYSRNLHFITRNFRTFERKYVTVKRLDKILCIEKPDVIHIHLELLKYIAKSKYVVEKKVKLIYTCHSVPAYHLYGEELKAARYLIDNNNLQMVALHDSMRKEINDLFGITNTTVLRNAVDFKKFRNCICKEEERKKLNIPQNAFVLGHVGRFNDVKNHNFLVDVFNEVVKQKPEAYLLMVGAGSDKPEIVAKLNSLGLQERYQIFSHRSDVNEIMKAMDVFVFPSKFEGLGITAVEAQVSGLRCVMSDAINSTTFLTDTAVALPLGDVKQWADVILNSGVKGKAYGNFDDWDMNKEIIKLENLYSERSV